MRKGKERKVEVGWGEEGVRRRGVRKEGGGERGECRESGGKGV